MLRGINRIPTINIKWWLRKSQKSKSDCTVYFDITINGMRTSGISTGIRITKNLWNEENKTIKDEKLNSLLHEEKKKIDLIYSKLVADNIQISANLVKQYYKDFNRKTVVDTRLLTVFKNFIIKRQKLIGKSFAERTVQTDKTRLGNLTKFLKSINNIHIDIREINLVFADKFVLWLKQQPKIKKHNYAVKHIQTLKQVIDEAIREEYLDYNKLDLYEMNLDKPDEPLYLSFEQVENLEKLCKRGFEDKILEKVADCFLFQVYTGFAYVDLVTFDYEKHTTIEEDFKEIWIEKSRVKSKEKAVLELLPKAQNILLKYNGKLPIYCNAFYNRILKQLAICLDVKFKLSSHIGRKTAGMYWLNKGVRIEVVSRMLGHSSIKTTEKIYAKVLKRLIREEMKKLK